LFCVFSVKSAAGGLFFMPARFAASRREPPQVAASRRRLPHVAAGLPQAAAGCREAAV